MFNPTTTFTIRIINVPIEGDAHKKVRENLTKLKSQRNQYHDNRRNAKDRVIDIGDTVLVKQPKTN